MPAGSHLALKYRGDFLTRNVEETQRHLRRSRQRELCQRRLPEGIRHGIIQPIREAIVNLRPSRCLDAVWKGIAEAPHPLLQDSM
mgnify:CR=1 FL=1